MYYITSFKNRFVFFAMFFSSSMMAVVVVGV